MPFSEFDAVVIGSSAGGIGVLQQILQHVPAEFPAPILVVQHVAPNSPSLLHRVLGRRSSMPVFQAEPGTRLRPGCVYLAPPGRHLEVENGVCFLTQAPKVHFWRPAVDVLFQSAARQFGPRTLGVVLTGFLHDGAAGTAAIRSAGGIVIAQSPDTCQASDMPRAAIREGVDFVLSPSDIVKAMISLVSMPGVAAMFGVGRYRRAA